LDQQQRLDYQRGYQVVNAASGSNLVTTGNGDYEVDIAAGEVHLGGSFVSAAQQTIDLSGQVDADDARFALIYRDTNGDAQFDSGSLASRAPSGVDTEQTYQPPAPTLAGTDGTVLALVLLRAGASAVLADDITDRRLPASLSVETVDARTVQADDVVLTDTS
jgi:hypothetical protein